MKKSIFHQDPEFPGMVLTGFYLISTLYPGSSRKIFPSYSIFPVDSNYRLPPFTSLLVQRNIATFRPPSNHLHCNLSPESPEGF